MSVKEVYFPDDSIYYDQWLTAQHLDDTVKQAKINKEKMEDGTIYKCEDSHHNPDDFFQFLPVYMGHVIQDH